MVLTLKSLQDRTHVERLKNRGKPHGEAVLIFWLGEPQFQVSERRSSVSTSATTLTYSRF